MSSPSDLSRGARNEAARKFRIPSRRALVAVAAVAIAVVSSACSQGAAAPRTGTERLYGSPVRLGNGQVRTYVLLDRDSGDRPLEIGVAMDEGALEGLPDGHAGMQMLDLALPQQHGTPYRFVQFDWNPMGHEPPGIYDTPHFDFHFYVLSTAERDSIDEVVLGSTEYAARGSALPPENERFANFVPLGPPGAAPQIVPRMGVHWASLASPELQGAFGNPEGARPFTTTFLRGSWNGRVTFDEPMITRAFVLGRKAATTAASRDSVIALPSAQKYRSAGYYPNAYRVRYDAQAKEYHIALTQLTKRE